MSDDAVVADALAPWRALRPQQYGQRSSHDVVDPLIEPYWSGIRTIVRVAGDEVAAIDENGDELDLPPTVGVALADAALASELVLDGYLSAQPAQAGEGLVVGRVERPSSGDLMRQMFIGGRRPDRTPIQRSIDIRPGDTVAFVATDLLSIDDQSLLDIPLLERKRLLDSALAEGELVRRSPFVRPPVERWLGSWRAMGFIAVAFKAANSRYHPGVENESWAIWRIPNR